MIVQTSPAINLMSRFRVLARVLPLGLVGPVVLLPWLGATWAGRKLPAFVLPPPLALPVGYPQFSWSAVALLIGAGLAFAAPWFTACRSARTGPHRQLTAPPGRRVWPVWGTFAVAWTLVWWVLAWTRFAWFAAAQRYTFFPLWLGFIVVVNAATERRGGACLLRRAPARWLGLFAASAVFWWLFEWLNRFVQNWHYLRVQTLSPLAYAAFATVCFSTVLPAVTAVREWLGTWPNWQARLAAGPRWPGLTSHASGFGLTALGLAGLFLTGVWPHVFYPALWAGPLLVAVGASVLAGRQGWWTAASRGDWRSAGSWAGAALLCGGAWEMWNAGSFAHWIYTVPYVDRWHVFAMPLLGYAGYLPFGLECAIVATWLNGGDPACTRAPADPPAV